MYTRALTTVAEPSSGISFLRNIYANISRSARAHTHDKSGGVIVALFLCRCCSLLVRLSPRGSIWQIQRLQSADLYYLRRGSSCLRQRLPLLHPPADYSVISCSASQRSIPAREQSAAYAALPLASPTSAQLSRKLASPLGILKENTNRGQDTE